MTNQHILQIAMRQSAVDGKLLGREDFTREENVVGHIG